VTAGDSADARDGKDTGIDSVGTDIGAEVVEVEVEVVIEVDIMDKDDDDDVTDAKTSSPNFEILE